MNSKLHFSVIFFSSSWKRLKAVSWAGRKHHFLCARMMDNPVGHCSTSSASSAWMRNREEEEEEEEQYRWERERKCCGWNRNRREGEERRGWKEGCLINLSCSADESKIYPGDPFVCVRTCKLFISFFLTRNIPYSLGAHPSLRCSHFLSSAHSFPTFTHFLFLFLSLSFRAKISTAGTGGGSCSSPCSRASSDSSHTHIHHRATMTGRYYNVSCIDETPQWSWHLIKLAVLLSGYLFQPGRIWLSV